MTDEVMMYSKEQTIDAEKLKRLLPKGVNYKVTDEIIELIGKMEDSTGLFQDYMEESLLSHLPVLREVKISLREYIDAIKYCNLKKAMTNEQAWEIVFPEKYKKLISEKRKTSSHVSMYNQNKIVTKIDAQMMIDLAIQYAPVLHKSIQKQVSIMDDPEASFMVQHLASKTLIETLKPMQVQKAEITIGQSDEAKESTERTYKEMAKIAENQQALLRAGHSLSDIQRLNLTISSAGATDEEDIIDVDDEADEFESRLGFRGN